MEERLEREVNQLHASICQALADPKRILILYELHEGPKTVTELTEALKVPQPTVSRHLKMLREQRLVYNERDGDERPLLARRRPRDHGARHHARRAPRRPRPAGGAGRGPQLT